MNRLALLIIWTTLGFMACQGLERRNPGFDELEGRWIDLSYEFSEETIYWPTAESFRRESVSFGETEAGYFYAANNFSAAEHGGTHLDAPIHFSRGSWTADQIPLDNLIGPAIVIDVSDHSSADYLVSRDDFETWESTHGQLAGGVIVLLRTGWGDRYPDRLRYLGTERTGPDAVPELHFPGLDPDAASWLVSDRGIAAIGIDTPSIDFAKSTLFESHRALFAANIPAFENVANLGELPATGSFVVALPMKIKDGSGGPLRIVAFVPGTGR